MKFKQDFEKALEHNTNHIKKENEGKKEEFEKKEEDKKEEKKEESN